MNAKQQYSDIVQLLDQIRDTVNKVDENSISLEIILEIAGRKSFGSLLFIAGIITLAPVIGDIPGIPSIMGIIVLLVAIQLLLNRKNLWLPQFLLNRSVKRNTILTALEKLRKPVRYLDHFSQPRLVALTDKPMLYVIAIVCICIAVAMPVMELIPFSANIAGILLTAFGLSLTTRDGLPIVIAIAFAILVTAIIYFHIF